MDNYPYILEGSDIRINSNKKEQEEESPVHFFMGIAFIVLFLLSVSINVFQFQENRSLNAQVQQKHDTIMGISALYLLKK